MNDDKVPAGKYAVSTKQKLRRASRSRLRTLLASPIMAAAAVTGKLTDPRELLKAVDLEPCKRLRLLKNSKPMVLAKKI
jgi:hypothetical protein